MNSNVRRMQDEQSIQSDEPLHPTAIMTGGDSFGRAGPPRPTTSQGVQLPLWALSLLTALLLLAGFALGQRMGHGPASQLGPQLPHRSVFPPSVTTSLKNNSCMDASTVPPAGPKTFDCRGFVIESTDMTWHRRDWATTEASIDKYFAPGWQSVRAYGTYIDDLPGLRKFMKEWLTGFPDVFIYMSDLFCEGNDEVGYKTTMPYVLTATNTGPSLYGNATGRKVKIHGIANCYIKKINGQWQYTNEWDSGDMLAFYSALKLDIDSVPHPPKDTMSIDECKPLFEWGSGKMNWLPSKEVLKNNYKRYGA